YNTIGGDRSRGRGPVGEGNLISGNGGSAIKIDRSNNVVVGNLVGTDLSGAKALGNNYAGVFITGGANNRIGGADPRDRNIVSGTTGSGIAINNGTGNLVIGNYVGTDITGTVGLGNSVYGISMEIGSANNVVQGNLASGNQLAGILIADAGSSYNAIIGNLIGTDATGAKSIPNGQGVNVGAPFNRIGGMRPEERNLISGNQGGSFINGFGTLVLGNYFGTDITGRQAIPSRSSIGVGARIFLAGNLISGQGFDGVNVTNYTYFGGNLVGIDASGQAAIPNNGFGVRAAGHHNIFQANVIANNRGGGISFDPLSFNTIRRDLIYDNAAKGIQCSSGCVGGLAAPVLTAVTATAASGTACPECEVEVFSDAGRQGRIFEGSIRADGSGSFRFEKQSALKGPNVTATATDRRGNTSEFSTERAVPKPSAATIGPRIGRGSQ
ncbi:MAG: right-handed parallel beta-helix repeat-containing protein, partial [Acidobacteria bacterium]|nr:right-handed parallel beta-helix repeat-containing protein [Acidobacteriota bacterium]